MKNKEATKLKVDSKIDSYLKEIKGQYSGGKLYNAFYNYQKQSIYSSWGKSNWSGNYKSSSVVSNIPVINFVYNKLNFLGWHSKICEEIINLPKDKNELLRFYFCLESFCNIYNDVIDQILVDWDCYCKNRFQIIKNLMIEKHPRHEDIINSIFETSDNCYKIIDLKFLECNFIDLSLSDSFRQIYKLKLECEKY